MLALERGEPLDERPRLGGGDVGDCGGDFGRKGHGGEGERRTGRGGGDAGAGSVPATPSTERRTDGDEVQLRRREGDCQGRRVVARASRSQYRRAATSLHPSCRRCAALSRARSPLRMTRVHPFSIARVRSDACASGRDAGATARVMLAVLVALPPALGAQAPARARRPTPSSRLSAERSSTVRAPRRCRTQRSSCGGAGSRPSGRVERPRCRAARA